MARVIAGEGGEAGRLKATRHGPAPYRDRSTGESWAGKPWPTPDEAQAVQVALGMAPKRDAADQDLRERHEGADDADAVRDLWPVLMVSWLGE